MALTHQLYISFEDVGTAEASRTWVDFSSRLLSFSVDGPGRDSELADVDAAVGEYLIDDRLRELDPTNPASARWPNVVPNRMLWHRVTDGTITYDVFKGYVDGWGPQREQPGGFNQRARVRVTDGTKRLTGNTFEAADPDVIEYSDVVSADEPSFYYRLGEPAGTKVIHHARKKRKRRDHEHKRHYHHHGFKRWTTLRTRADAEGISGPAGTYKNTPLLGVPGFIKGDTDTAVQFRAAQSEYAQVVVDVEQFKNVNAFTLEAWVQPASIGTNTVIAGPRNTVGANQGPIFTLSIAAGPTWHSTIIASDTIATVDSTTLPAVGVTQHIVATWDGGDLLLYVNGNLEDSASLVGALDTPDSDLFVMIGAGNTPANYFDGVIDEVALYEKALSSDRVLAHYEAGLLGFDSMATGRRIEEALKLHDSTDVSTLTFSGNEITDTLRVSGTTGDGRPRTFPRNVLDADEIAQTTLSAGVTNVATTLPITAWQSQWPTNSAFRIMVDKETMIVTAGFGTTSLTVVRGVAQMWGTAQAAAAHSAGAVVTDFFASPDTWEWKAPSLGGIGSDQAQVTTTPSGQRALKLTVRPGDQNDAADATRERIEGHWTGGAGDTGERWFYRWSNEFPSDFAANNANGVYIRQVGPNHNFGNPAIWIRAEATDQFKLGFNTGVLNTGTGVGTFTNTYTFDIPLTKQVRHDFILEVDWELTATGKVNLWHREEGQAWENILALTGIITSSSLSGATPAIKFGGGIYRSADAVHTQYLYLYDVMQGPSWEDVQVDPLGERDSSTGVWAAATNFVTAELDTWTVIGTASRATDAAHQFMGAALTRVDITGVGDGISQTFTGLTIGTTYTASLWIDRDELDARFHVFEARNNANTANVASTNIRRQKGLQRVTISWVAAETAGRLRLRQTDATNRPVRMWAGRPQIEAGPIATPFAGINTTRAAARVQAPKVLLNETQSWVAMRVRPGWSTVTEAYGGAGVARFFSWQVDANNRIVAFYQESNNRVILRRVSAAAGADAFQTGVWNAGEEVTVIFAWTATQTKVSFNGAAFTATANTSIPNLSTATLIDMANLASADQLDGDIKWAAWGTGTLTDADALALETTGLTAGLSNRTGFRSWQGSRESAGPWVIMMGLRTMPRARYAGLPIKDIIDEAVAAEGEPGVFYYSAAGLPTFLDAGYRNGVSTAYSFGNNSGQISFEDAALSDSDSFLYNIIRGTNDEGSATFEAQDATSIARYGRLVLPLDSLPLAADDEVQAYLEALLKRYKDPIIRVPSIVLSSLADQASVLSLYIGSQVFVSVPVVAASQIHQGSWVEGRRLWQDEGGVVMGSFSISPR